MCRIKFFNCNITTDILSREPPISECFYAFNPGHSPGSGSVVVISHYVSVVSVQLFSSLFSHNQLDARSAVRLSFLTALFLSPPVMHTVLNIFHSDCAGKPLTPTSTGKIHARHPRSIHWF